MTQCLPQQSIPGTEPATLVELLRQRALQQPDKLAYTFLIDGKVEGPKLTYAELDRQARAIGALLQQHQVKGERALLLYPQGLEVMAAFLGCLYAGVIAIPLPPPEASRLKRTLPRLEAIAKDAQASFVLTTGGILSQLNEFREEIPEFRAMRWIDTEQVNLKLAEEWQDPQVTSDMLAYLQYTSGSTSTPKGVMISHGNVIFHCRNLQKACGYDSDSVTVTWMPYFHDYGLVEGLTVPLFNGHPCYVMSPFAFLKHPFNWLQAISRYKGTHSQAPNFAYDQCVRRVKPNQLEQLDLSSWQAAGNAAEPINPKVMEAFVQKFEPCGFRWSSFAPAYGLAEATLLVSTSPKQEEPVFLKIDGMALERHRIVPTTKDGEMVRTLPGCGRLVCQTKVVIANPDTKTKCDPDEVGEIWVSDPSVAGGYWNRPEESKETFQAYLTDTGEGPFLRTGDLGFMHEGQLYIGGRIKDLIIIRGTNHYPQDIEWTVQHLHPALRADYGAAFSVELNGEERLVVVQEVERKQQQDIDCEEVIAAIRQAIAEQHELQVYGVVLAKPGNILKTSSGKIQRRACKASWMSGELEVLADWSENPTLTAKYRNLQAEVNSLLQQVQTSR